jgi:hypothetical protein
MSKRAKAGKDNNQCQYHEADGVRCTRKASNGVVQHGTTFIFCERHIETAREAVDA